MPVDIQISLVTLPWIFSEKIHPSGVVPFLIMDFYMPEILSNKDELRVHNQTQGRMIPSVQRNS